MMFAHHSKGCECTGCDPDPFTTTREEEDYAAS
jgi:hypothetical protein